MSTRLSLYILLVVGVTSHLFAADYKDAYIQYKSVQLTAAEKQVLRESMSKLHGRYDPQEKMLTKQLTGWNYHTDAESGVYHEVRSSLNYAVGLLDLGEQQYEQRAFDIIRKVISLQDTISTNRTAGIWPYYLEEPLATKKSPADWNWANFNGVSLLDIYMGHQARLPEDLKSIIRNSLVYAARSIQKRNVQPGYTNIAIMGTYVTFMVSHLFDLPEMKVYATNRLNNFYDYTLQRGFNEYNSPTYTIVALDELDRMKRHIVDKEAKPKIDSLYTLAWEVVARHYHKPSGQWAGPHSRAYNSLLTPSIYGILKQASGGRVDLPGATARNDVKIRHQIPEHLMPFFLSPRYPRTQRDVLSIDDPQIVGTTYLTDKYTLSTANRSSLWNQRRPFLVYWGTPGQPHSLQVRLLHDLYDFSSASFYSDQKENNVLAAINFLTNGGDKHISIDRLKDGKFRAKDLRLRFEFGNVPADRLTLPKAVNEFYFQRLDDLTFGIQLFHAAFGDHTGYWEKGGDDKAAWMDYVIYSGAEKDIDLTAMNEAVLGFRFHLTDARTSNLKDVKVANTAGTLSADWQGLTIKVPVKPMPQPKNL